MIADTRTPALLCQNASLESLVKQIEDGILIGGGVADFHGADERKFKGAAEDSSIPQQMLTVTAQFAHALVEGGGN